MSDGTFPDAEGGQDPVGLQKLTPLIQWIRTNADRLSWAVVVIGALAQLAHYFGNRSVWLDEAYLSFNFIVHDAGQLLGPSYFSQLAPAGWMQLESLAYHLTHSFEFGLRALPVAFGLASIVLFRKLAFRVLDSTPALLAVALLSLSPVVVMYSVMIKPYSADLLCAVVLLLLAEPMLRRNTLELKELGWLGTAGLLGIAVSLPIVYVLAAVGSVLFLKFARERRWRDAAGISALAIAWLGCFAALYLLVYRAQMHSGTLQDAGPQHFFRRTGFAPFPIRSMQDIAWYGDNLSGFVRYYFYEQSVLAASLAAIVGIIILGRARPSFALVLILMLVIGLGGSAAQAYPLYERFTLFLLPGLALAVAASVGPLLNKTGWRWLIGGAAALALLAGPVLILQWQMRRAPPYAVTHMTPAMAILGKTLRVGDGLYVQASSAPAYLVYRGLYGLAHAPWTVGYQPSWACLANEPALYAQTRTFILAPILTGSKAMPPFTAEDAAQLESLGFAVTVLASRPDLKLIQLDRRPAAPRLASSACTRQEPLADLENVLRDFR